MALIAYILAIVLFLVAGFTNGVDASWEDFTAFGLAFFALGHVLGGIDLPVAVRRQ